MIVKDLVSLLVEGNQNAKVVFLDHYGNPIETSKFTFHFANVKNACVNSTDNKKSSYFIIESPNLGPEPD